MLGIGLGITSRLRSSVFNPASLFRNSEQGWFYDLSDMSTLFQDAAGTTPVTAVGQPVGLCLDKSGRGNHRRQTISLNRPTYARHPLGGIRNLLTRTEEFGNPVWIKSGLTVSGNIVTATGTISRIYQLATLASGVTHTYSVKLKVGTCTRAAIRAVGFDTQPGAWFDLSSGTVGTVDSGLTAAISAADADGFYRCQIRFSSTTDLSGDFSIYPVNENGSYTVTSGRTLQIKEAQLETGSSATPYQRVGSVFDVTEAGVPDLYYLSYDGLNDSLSTAPFAWGSDKATICAGVRKLSDAAIGAVAEFSPDTNTNQGSWNVFAPENTSIRYSTISRGSAQTASPLRATITSTGAAPDTAVITGIHDISGDLSRIRCNGVAGTDGTADKGTGNFGTYPVFFGARAGTSLFFNGREYSSFAINRLLTANELSQIERYTAQRTGVTL